MSFILDALKKSEAERQRQAGPTLLEVRISRPRRRYPIWAAIVGVLLGINAVILVVFWLHRQALSQPEGPPAVAASPAAAPAGPALPSGAAATPPPLARAAAGPTPAANGSSGPGAGASAALPASPDPSSAVAPLTASDNHNPADDEPALPAGSAHVQRAAPDNYTNLPNISEIGGNVPALQLDLLDYSDAPAERYALINMHRVREGDVLPEGPRVLAITRDGVALNYRGQDFLLRPGGGAQ